MEVEGEVDWRRIVGWKVGSCRCWGARGWSADSGTRRKDMGSMRVLRGWGCVIVGAVGRLVSGLPRLRAAAAQERRVDSDVRRASSWIVGS